MARVSWEGGDRGGFGGWRRCGRLELQALEIEVTGSGNRKLQVRSCRLEGRKFE